MQNRSTCAVACRPERYEERHEVIGVWVSTFSVRGALPIVKKTDTIASGHRFGQPAAELPCPVIGGSAFAKRCRGIAKRMHGAAAADHKHAFVAQRRESSTERYVLRRI